MEGLLLPTIEKLREARGWSRKELADLLGVSVQSVHYWEAGLKLPTIRHVRTMAGVFGVPMEEIDAEGPYDSRDAKSRRDAMRGRAD